MLTPPPPLNDTMSIPTARAIDAGLQNDTAKTIGCLAPRAGGIVIFPPPQPPWYAATWVKSLVPLAISVVGGLYGWAQGWWQTTIDEKRPLVSRVTLLDAPDEARANASAVAIRGLLTSGKAGEAGLPIATALAQMVQSASLTSLSPSGKQRVFKALSQIPTEAWKLPKWRAARGLARRALHDFTAKTDPGVIVSDLDHLRKNLQLGPEFTTGGSRPCLVFPQYAVISGDDADDMRANPQGLAWNGLLLGPATAREWSQASQAFSRRYWRAQPRSFWGFRRATF